MSFRRPLALLGALVLTSAQACGGATPPPVVATAPTSSAPPASPPVPVRRGPSDSLRAHWSFDDAPEFILYADVAGLLHTQLAQGLLAGLLTVAKTSLNSQQAQCIDDVVASTKEILIGGKGESSIILVRFDESVAKPTTCLAVASATATQLPGAPDAYRTQDGPIAHLPGLLVMGPDADVVRALQQSSPKPTPDVLMMNDDQFVAWAADVNETGSARGGLVASSERFRLDLEADLPEMFARKLETQLQALKGASALPVADPAEAALLKSLLAAVTLKRDGKHISGAFELKEPVIEQARDLGAAVSLSVFAVRKYIANAKAAEARNTVGQIAKDYAAYWEKENAGGRGKGPVTKKLVSFAAVPKTVPRGEKYRSTADDWKPWATLGFSMETPQYYQYEVRASKDGKSADVLARGDINGDGKASLFSLHLAVDPKTHALVLGPKLEETDPQE